ncbi:ATP-binding cassette domain-containing protein [Streptomyces albidus (ex Kaewkla and Franco 2022)]|uniref:ATP-binding cassette domain-containing protein n=1 Tax=Streptomyces albidus (ex Kaewkla and Franco 2022) TaxID=722709 RepID=UPI0015EF727F|nr:ATP-binding cassette domain-containing protein [Streptomyces albidus (ex Kaewkla and Franco 2022)]
MDEAIEAVGVVKSYGAVQVLKGVDLSVRSGSVAALLGPNGAGKTTMVRILATLTTADAGEAAVAGCDVRRERSEVRRRISLTGQYAALDELQTGMENLRMMAGLTGMNGRKAKARSAELLGQFDLEHAADRRVKTYSGGMRRRLDIAAGLVGSPSVIFLDEPTTGLDVRSRHTMWSVVSQLARSGVTVLLTTQYLEEADHLADRVAVLDQGRIVAEGTPAQLKQRVGGHRLDLTTTDHAAFSRLRAELGARAMAADARELTLSVATDGTAAEVRSLLDELDPAHDAIDRFSTHGTSLDDVFIALTGRAAVAGDGGGPASPGGSEREAAHV